MNNNDSIIINSDFTLYQRVLIFIKKPTLRTGVAILTNRYTVSTVAQMEKLFVIPSTSNNQHTNRSSSQKINSRSTARISKAPPLDTTTNSGNLKKNEESPSITAAKNGDLESIKSLVNSGKYDKDSLDKEKNNPLHCAIENGHLETVKYLIETDKQKDKKEDQDDSSCSVYLFNNYRHPLEVRTENNYNKNKNGQTILHTAAKHGNLEMMQYLVNNRPTPRQGYIVNWRDDNYKTPFFVAAENGNKEIMEYWFDKFNKDKNTKVQINEMPDKYHTILSDASKNGHLHVVKFLVDHGADVNRQAYMGSKALTVAIEEGHLDIVKYLLENKADKQEKSCINRTLLSINLAIKKLSKTTTPSEQSFNIFKAILDATESHAINNHDDTGCNALTQASHTGNLEAVKCLLDKGANINLKSNRECSMTPLHHAIESDNIEIVKFLIERGADTTMTTSDNQTALDIAKKSAPDNYAEIEKLLKNA